MKTLTDQTTAHDTRNVNDGSRGPVIDYVIMTVSRPRSYISNVLHGIPHDLPVRLIVGSPDVSYLAELDASALVDIVPPSSEEWIPVTEKHTWARAAWNYWRCLLLGPRSPNISGLVVFEDDILLARGWQRRLHDTIHCITNKHGSHFVLALYACDASIPTNASQYYEPYQPESFFGTQAMYFPEAIRSELIPYLKDHGVDAFRAPYDLLIKEFIQQSGYHLFRCTPCLAQHIGRITTGLGFFHEAASFSLELEV